MIHTSGEWIVRQNKNPDYRLIPLVIGTDGSLLPADAKLIAAAPALLEAMKLAVRYLEHPDVQALPFALSAECAANRARDAIEAAK